MQAAKETVINNVLLAMSTTLSPQQLDVLNNVLVKSLYNYEVTQATTLPSTLDDTNEYLISMFVAKKQGKLSKETIKFYLKTIYKLTDTVHKPLTTMSSIDISYFLDTLSGTNSARSINNHRRNVSAFFTWMRKNHYVLENPVEAIDAIKEERKPIDHLEPSEKEKLKEGCVSIRDRAILEFLRSTAVRIGEIHNLKVSDVDLVTGKISLYAPKTRDYRYVWLDQVALDYYRQYLETRPRYKKDAPLFTSNRGNALSKEAYRYIY